MVIIGLGSNIEDRYIYLNQAIKHLVHGHDAPLVNPCYSPIYEAAALLKKDAPASWNKPYLNMVVVADTSLSPERLLVTLKTIEQTLGRKERGRWAPREIDLDIIAYDDVQINTPSLTIPHPGLSERSFVYRPLLDLLPEYRIPGTSTLLKTHISTEKTLIRTSLTIKEQVNG